MNAAAAFIRDRIATHLAGADPARALVVLGGLPESVLGALYSLVTAGGTARWRTRVGATELEVPVLFVPGDRHHDPAIHGDLKCTRCTWDFAVNARSSCPVLLVLVSPARAAEMPESISNAANMLGFVAAPASSRALRRQLGLLGLPAHLSEMGGTADPATIASVIAGFFDGSDGVPTDERLEGVWTQLDILLTVPTPAVGFHDSFLAALGLPSDPRDLTLGQAGDLSNILDRLGAFLGSQGMDEGLSKLRLTTAAADAATRQALSDFRIWLFANAGLSSAAGFERATRWFFRQPRTPLAWWALLPAPLLESMLDEAGATRRSERVEISITNAIGNQHAPDDQPWLVRDNAAISISLRAAGDLTGSRLLLAPAHEFAQLAGAGPHVQDLAFPVGEVRQPFILKVEGGNVKAETARVLSLARFATHSFLEFPDASSNPGPAFKDGKWHQMVTLVRGGNTRLRVHLASPGTVARLTVDAVDMGALSDGEQRLADLEIGSSILMVVSDAGGIVVAEVNVSIALDSPDDTAARSYFEALVQAHRSNKRLVSPIVMDSAVRRLESTYLESSESWRPVLACLRSDARIDPRGINWADPRIGETTGIPDVRPQHLTPPQALLDARTALRSRLSAEGRPIPDIDLGGHADFATLADKYLRAYLEWFRASPDSAAWFDCMLLHASVFDPQSGSEVPMTTTTAILLSPLHPIRFAWQQHAQRVLKESLDSPCPTAGLLASRSAPDAGAWRLGALPAAFVPFFSRSCSDPYWSVLWNSNALSDPVATAAAETVLEHAGLRLAAVASGFDASQVRHALGEVAGMLSARTTLRCGISGAHSTSTALTEGVFDWVGEHFGDNEEHGLPNAVEIYDGREAGAPGDEQLGHLSALAEGRIRWFNGNNGVALDLAIIDQLSTGIVRAVPTDLRSAIGPGALTRIRLRMDSDQATRLVETRVAGPLPAGATPLDEAIAAFEERAAQTSSRSTGLESQPNQQAIGHRLGTAQLVAVTSGQIDLACLTRGIEAQRGFLWDYEIPSLLDADQQAGYYLIARPSEGMRQSIELAIRHLTQRQPTTLEVMGVLREVSRRGIPVLKRVSEGGTNARGELGALLAARYLQDVFRPGASRSGIPVHAAGIATMLMPVDPFADVFSEVGTRLVGMPKLMRPDFIAFCIRREPGGIAVRVTPVEVKYRQGDLSTADCARAHEQAKNYADLVRAAMVNPPNKAWEAGGSALLAESLDYSFRLHASPDITGVSPNEWAALHQDCIRHVLARSARLETHPTGIVIAIQASPTRARDSSGDGLINEVLLGPADTASIYQSGAPYEQDTATFIGELGIGFPNQPIVDEPSVGVAEDPAPVLLPPAPAQVRPPDTPARAEPAVPPPAPPHPAQPAAHVVPPPATPAPAPQIPVATPAPAPTPTTVGALSAETRAQVDASFEGFVGNSEAVSILRRDALFARLQQPVHLKKAYLFTGSPSTGKTTLAARLAVAIGVPEIRLDGRAEPLRSREALFDAINAALISRGQRPVRRSLGGAQVSLEYPPFLLFIDEAHLVPDRVQESLLTMVESNDRTAVIDVNRKASVPLATFVFATTRASDVDGPLRTRCDEVQLRDYELDEVAEITRRKYPDWPQEVHARLAILGRRIPRISLELARSLETEVVVNGNAGNTLDQLLDAVARSKRLDDLGLTPADRQYLQVLQQQQRAVGRDAMLNLLASVDRNRITEEIEPYLTILQFIRLTAAGRELAPNGRRYLEQLRAAGGR